jgi:hypothetical protein
VAFKLETSDTAWNRGRIIQFKNRLQVWLFLSKHDPLTMLSCVSISFFSCLMQIKVQFFRGIATKATRWFHIVADAASLVLLPSDTIETISRPFDGVDDTWTAVGKSVSFAPSSQEQWQSAVVRAKRVLELPGQQRMSVIRVQFKNPEQYEWLDVEVADSQRVRYQNEM